MTGSGQQIETVHSHFIYSFEALYEAIEIGRNATQKPVKSFHSPELSEKMV